MNHTHFKGPPPNKQWEGAPILHRSGGTSKIGSGSEDTMVLLPSVVLIMALWSDLYVIVGQQTIL